MQKLIYLLSVSILVLTGCETTQSGQSSRTSETRKHPTIFVKPVDASAAKFKGDNSHVSILTDADKQRISAIIRNAILERLAKNGFIAPSDFPKEGRVIDAAVTLVDKGSFSKRFLIGAGAGSASITAQVKVSNLADGSVLIANQEVIGSSKLFTGGMYSNEDWMAIYSVSVGYKIADLVNSKLK